MNHHWSLTVKIKLVALSLVLTGSLAAEHFTGFGAKAAEFTTAISSRINGVNSMPRLFRPTSAPVAVAPIVLAAPAMMNMFVSGCATPSFSSATNFGTGSAPFSVAVGDFNLDGKPDLTVVEEGVNKVSVLLGNGVGSFGAATPFSVGTTPVAVAVGDFNLDGKLDLAVANTGSNNVSILLGNGAGSFGAATPFSVGSGPFSVTVGDFNLDGKPDLATPNGGSNNVSVRLGTGTGSFGAVTNFPVGTNPQFVGVGDFNKDGNPDMAVANVGSNNISVLLGTGTGSFGAATNIGVGNVPISVAVGDFNLDGMSDLAVANASSNNVSVLPGNGMGGFAAPTNFSVGTNPFSIVMGDFNLDGKPDLATANGGANNVSVLLGTGTGSFGAATNFGTGNGPLWVAMGDLNLDGKPDIVTANASVNNVSVLLNTCNGAPCSGASFDPKTDFGTGSTPFSVAVGDFNLDGKPDLTVVEEGVNKVSVLLGNGAGSFGAATPFSVGTTPVAVAVGDFNLDGKLDLAVANTGSNNVSILLGNGAGSFGAATPFSVGSGPFSVTVGDFNLDGKPDLATPNGGSNNVSVRLGTGTGSFGAVTNFPVGTNPQFVGVGDFNKDGNPDMAVANVGSNNISVLLGTGTGSFGAATNIGVGNVPISVAVGDFNLDGMSDLAVANLTSNNVSVLPGNGMGGFAAPTNFSVGTNPYSIVMGDFNLDGKTDLATANGGANNVSVLLGTGTGSFGAATNFGTGIGPLWVAMGDLNLDGKPDLAVADASSNKVSVLLNNCTANQPPTLTPLAGVNRQQGSPSGNSQIATASDMENAANILQITISSDGMTFGNVATLNGVTVTLTDSNLGAMGANPDAMGKVFADVVASCTATNANFRLKLTDSGGLSDTKTFTVNVTANTAPTLSYNSANKITGTVLMVNPATGPSDNGSVSSIIVQSVGPSVPAGLITVNNISGIVTVANTVPPGNYTVTIRATDNCGVTTDASFALVVPCVNTLTVNDLGDTADAIVGDGICNDGTGKCTLRAAIQEANALTACSPFTINFNVTGTINLATALPNLNHPNLTIDGPGANLLNVRRNSAAYFRIYQVNGGKTVSIDGLTISNGDVSNGSDGGGIQNFGTLSVTGCAIVGNKANGGGGILNNSGVLVIDGSTISGNTANFSGGGLYNFGNATTTVTNSTISSNTGGAGFIGGIFNGAGSGQTALLKLINCTVTGNVGSNAIAVWNFGGATAVTTQLLNTLVAGNSGNNFVKFGSHLLTSLGNNLDSDGTSGFTNGVNGDIVGTSGSPINALLAPLANYGGPTQTHALLPGSPAINAGTGSGAPSADQRGIGRVGAVDIGAFESRGFTLAINGGNNQSTFVNTAFANPLSVAVSSSFSEPVNGGQVIFTPPGSGASAAIAVNPATITGGTATTGTVTANGTVGGPYTVAAAANGATSGVNFSLTNLNPPPQIMAGGPLNRQQGSAAINAAIATVNDANQSAGSLVVTATTVPAGITVTNIVNNNGAITADVAAGCNAALGNNLVELTVTDNFMATSTANLTVNVTANTAPVLTYGALQNVIVGNGLTINAATGPSDNGSVSTIIVENKGTFTGNVAVNAAGVVTISSAAPLGSHTITIRATDNCGAETDATFVIAVSAVTASIADPALCTGPGGAVDVTATVTNGAGSSQSSTFTASLPAGLLAVPGTCSANVGICNVVNGSTVSWSGTLAGNQTVTIKYKAQIGDQIVTGTQLCITSSATVGGSPAGSVVACLTVNCPALGTGAIPDAKSPASDQKAGSALFYNIYSSDAANYNAQNTRISITNTHPVLRATVHLFFVDGVSCTAADQYLCLTPNQTYTFLASDIDPGTTGYLVAVAVDDRGCPIDFNYLIGDEYIKLNSGHAANLGAEAISALAGGLPLCDGNSTTATLNFDGVSYNGVPRVLAVDNIPAKGDSNETLLILNRFGGNLSAGGASLGTIFGLLYDDVEQGYSFNITGGCQLRSILSNSFPRTAPRFESAIPPGRTGWMKLYSLSDIGMFGAVINLNKNSNVQSGAFNQGHNLHQLTLTQAATLIIPVFPPRC